MFLDQDFTDQIDNAALEVNNIIITAADHSLRKKAHTSKKPRSSKKWYDTELWRLKRSMTYKGGLYSKYPTDPYIRGSFYKSRKLYSKACKLKQRMFKETMIDKLNTLNENDPKAYWDLLNKLKEDKGNIKSNVIPSEEWVEYLSKLNTPSPRYTDRIKEIESMLETCESPPTFSPIDYKFTNNEILTAINSLKNGKAAGLDGVLNEMFKHSTHVLLPCLLKLFNLIFTHSTYPALLEKQLYNSNFQI